MSSGDPPLTNLSDDKGNDGKGLSCDTQPADVVNVMYVMAEYLLTAVASILCL